MLTIGTPRSTGAGAVSTVSGWIGRFARDERGATAIEYALIASLIAMAIVTGVTMVGTALNTKLANVATLTK